MSTLERDGTRFFDNTLEDIMNFVGLRKAFIEAAASQFLLSLSTNNEGHINKKKIDEKFTNDKYFDEGWIYEVDIDEGSFDVIIDAIKIT